MLDFIISIFYGINKNKNGKEISNYEKYIPWDDGEYSGKISYILDNKQEIEVYRNFNKKNPQIFDKNANDISKNFNISKTEGNLFFYEQTKVDEDLFNMSMVIHQQEIQLNEKAQNDLIQKASNIMLTGEDSISYKKICGKLNKRQSEEIGTLKSPTKPLYMVKQRLEELNLEKQELEMLIPVKEDIQMQIKNSQIELSNEEEAFKILQEKEIISNMAKLEEEKIEINKRAKEELEGNKQTLEQELKQIKPEMEKSKKLNILFIIPLVLLIISIISYTLKNIILFAVGVTISILSFAIILGKNLKNSNKIKIEQEEVITKKGELNNKIELIEKEINSKQNLIQEQEKALKINLKMKNEQIKIKYPNANIIDIQRLNILEEQNYINHLKLRMTQKELELKNIYEKLENLIKIEEMIDANNQIYEGLLQYDEVINIAKQALDSAYLEMKESVTPRFAKNLSNSINNITDGKYKTVKINEENGLSLEIDNR